MFLYAWKGSLYVDDSEEIVSCSECCREMVSGRSFQTQAKSKELPCRLNFLKTQDYRMLISGMAGELCISEFILDLDIFRCFLS